MKEDRSRKGGQRKGGDGEGGSENQKKRKRWCVTYKGGGGKGGGRRTETIIALSYHCTVINSLLAREPVPRLGSGLMTNHLHTALRPWLFMTRALLRTQPGSQLGPNSSWAGIITPGTQRQPQMGHSVTSHHPLPLLSYLTASSAHHPLVTGDNSVSWSIPVHQLAQVTLTAADTTEKKNKLVLTTCLSFVVFLYFFSQWRNFFFLYISCEITWLCCQTTINQIWSSHKVLIKQMSFEELYTWKITKNVIVQISTYLCYRDTPGVIYSSWLFSPHIPKSVLYPVHPSVHDVQQQKNNQKSVYL